MNERIKQLAEQADIRFGRMAILDGDPRGMARYVTYSEFEKFAELIVRECVTQLELVRKYRYDRIQPLETQQTIIDECQYQIKQHFGVEE